MAFWQARESDRALPWMPTGLLIGGGVLSKYTALLELVSFARLLRVEIRSGRRQLRRPGFYLMIGMALLFLLPALVWNIQHAWPTTTWLKHRGDLDSAWRFRPLGSARVPRRAGRGHFSDVFCGVARSRLPAALPRPGGTVRGALHPRALSAPVSALRDPEPATRGSGELGGGVLHRRFDPPGPPLAWRGARPRLGAPGGGGGACRRIAGNRRAARHGVAPPATRQATRWTAPGVRATSPVPSRQRRPAPVPGLSSPTVT